MNATRESWRPVVGWEGLYEVSDHGRVRSLDRVVRNGPGGRSLRKIPGRVLKPYPRPPMGYPSLKLGHRGRGMFLHASVHTLVLEAFVCPRPLGLEACHNDGNLRNNHLSNLRWDTRQGNIFDAVAHGRHNHARKTHCKRRHEFTQENTYIKANGSRQCRECLRTADRRRYAKRRERAANKH